MIATPLLLLALSLSPDPPAAEPAAPPLPSVVLPPALDRVLRDYERAWRSRDAAALAGLFTEDGFVLSNGSPPVRGRDAIRRKYASAGGSLALRAFEWSIDGSTGWIVGGFGQSEGAPDGGKFILALRRGTDGRWRIAADMDNSNRGVRVAPAPTPSSTP
jgi:ketosteroid isomerase-like protein